MDGIHDMGGMHGFGPLEPEADEPVFHEPWEGRTVGLMVATSAKGLRAGSMRPAIEAIDPATYLASSYYERWARGIEAQLVAGGSLTVEEIEGRAATVGAHPVRSAATDPDLVAAVPAFLDRPTETSGQPVVGAFGVGDEVTVGRTGPLSHHRCPRYVRGATGTVTRMAGGWPAPGSDDIEAIYTVRFAMRDVWGDDAEPGHLYIDLWERYLT